MQMLELEFDQRLQAAKLNSLKEFAYGAGHELNNPLANIASRAQTLLREESDPERRRRLTAINTQAFRRHEMLADMMLYARPPKLTPKQADLVSLIGEVLAELNETAAEQKTSLHGPLRREPLSIEIDAVQIRVALKALVMNAIEALGSDGNVTIELEATDVGESSTDYDAEEAVRITVMDDGPGVPVELHDKLFDPFFSGREANRGLGFGLCKCWRIVTSHGGRIELQSGHGSGTSVTMTLPVSRALRPSALSRRSRFPQVGTGCKHRSHEKHCFEPVYQAINKCSKPSPDNLRAGELRIGKQRRGFWNERRLRCNALGARCARYRFVVIFDWAFVSILIFSGVCYAALRLRSRRLSLRIHVGRVARCHCDHRNPDRAALAGNSIGAGGGSPIAVREQFEAIRVGDA